MVLLYNHKTIPSTLPQSQPSTKRLARKMRRIEVKINWWRLLHWLIIIFFLQGAVYAAYLLFFVVEGGGPLFQRAAHMPAEVIIVRRLYALETYLNTTGLALYLALTEILPRKLKQFRP